jgi:N-acyl-D-aspartate/D-glutamate deacylase
MGPRGLYRTAKPEEVEKMKVLLETELQKGSIGLNTGLEYESSFFSNRDEVLELAKVAAINGGRYMSHIRSEDINLTEAIDEIIDIGREAKIPVQISWKNSPSFSMEICSRNIGKTPRSSCRRNSNYGRLLSIYFLAFDFKSTFS